MPNQEKIHLHHVYFQRLIYISIATIVRFLLLFTQTRISHWCECPFLVAETFISPEKKFSISRCHEAHTRWSYASCRIRNTLPLWRAIKVAAPPLGVSKGLRWKNKDARCLAKVGGREQAERRRMARAPLDWVSSCSPTKPGHPVVVSLGDEKL